MSEKRELVSEWWEVVRLGFARFPPYYCGRHNTKAEAQEYIRRSMTRPREDGVQWRVIRVRRWRYSSHVVGKP